jgi:hypothetical protein
MNILDGIVPFTQIFPVSDAAAHNSNLESDQARVRARARSIVRISDSSFVLLLICFSLALLSTQKLSAATWPQVTQFSCNPASATSYTCAATLSSAMPSQVDIKLSSNNRAVTVPANLVVPAGATSVSFPLTVTPVTTTQTVTLTASLGRVSSSFSFQLKASTPALNPSSTSSSSTLSVSSSSVSFGDVSENTSATQSLTLSNTGSAALTVNSIAVSGSGFSWAGVSLPLTLNASQTAMVSVAFDPTAVGSATGTLTVKSTASTNPTSTVSLSGTGQSSAYSVLVTWQAPASSSDAVAKYDVYRSPSASSSYQLVGSVNDSQLAYTDTGVQNGQSYNYVVESVDSSGNESAPSNMASVTVP